jgi:hypothetical protein
MQDALAWPENRTPRTPVHAIAPSPWIAVFIDVLDLVFAVMIDHSY